MNQCSVEGGSEVVPLASASGFTILATHPTTALVPEFVILNLCWMKIHKCIVLLFWIESKDGK